MPEFENYLEERIEALEAGAQSGASVVMATPYTTETKPNTVSGSGDMTVLVFPDYTTALAIMIEGDEFPRIILGSDGSAGFMLGDGTYDPQSTGPYLYATDGGNFVMKARSGHGIQFQSDIGFFSHAPAAKPTGVAVTPEAIHAALVSLGLIAGP